jgi:ferric-dicitrate binding protein FerR (iron transport regulator)
LSAAVVVGLLGWLVYQAVWQTGPEGAPQGDPSPWRQYANASNTHSVVALADGSRVELWPGATIRFRMDTLRHMRMLQLQGSARFDVTQRAGWAFEVNGHGMAVLVLGTRFTVADYQEDARVEVTVHSGRVEVRAASEGGIAGEKQSPMILLPNHKAEFNKETGRMTHTLADEILPIEAEGPSANGTVSLDFREGVALSQLMRALEQVYGVTISVQGKSLQSSTMMGNFSGKELHDILDIICISLNAVYAIGADSIVMKPKAGG